MVTSSLPRSTPRATSTSRLGARTASTAASAASGRARTTRSASSSTRPAGTRGRWVFDYDPQDVDDDESGFHFESHAFSQGEYVSIRGEDGEMHTYQVMSVTPAT